MTAGLETLHKRGFNATSVDDIAKAAGAPKGSFYNHFSSKEDFGAAAVSLYAEKVGTRLAVLDERGLAPLERLRRYFEAMAELSAAPDAPGCLLGNFAAELSSQSPAIRERVSAAFADWRLALARVIAEAQRGGDIRAESPPEALAAFLIDAWEGALLRTKVEQSPAPLRGFLDIAFTKILT
ncbi:MAG TPA: TetR family transcriptional regulator C-terminal domain-containing protein [Roseiarcus sp.]